MTSRRLLAALCAVFVLVPVTATATAAPPASAERFAAAALRVKEAINGLEAQFKASADAADLPRCVRALERDMPQSAVDRAAAVFAIAIFQPFVETGLAPLQQMVRDLEAIPTSDIALRSGRAAWRTNVELLARIRMVARPCETLDAWARGGWRSADAPNFSVKEFEALVDRTDTTERKLKRAEARLRQLGISRGAARRFRGDDLFDDVSEEVGFDESFDVPGDRSSRVAR